MAAEINWQKSLRRSTGDVPIIKKKIVPQQARKRLSSIQECEVFDENISCKIKPMRNGGARRKLSSVSENNENLAKAKKTTLLQSPAKIGKATSFLKKIPTRLEIPKEAEIKRDIPSPIPLPPGVFSKFLF